MENKSKDLAGIAKDFGRSKVKSKEYSDKLEEFGFQPDEITNNAIIVASIFSNAAQGDMAAIEKWQELTQEDVKQEADQIADILSRRKSNGKPNAVRKNRA
jgi:hypothetical protein